MTDAEWLIVLKPTSIETASPGGLSCSLSPYRPTATSARQVLSRWCGSGGLDSSRCLNEALGIAVRECVNVLGAMFLLGLQHQLHCALSEAFRVRVDQPARQLLAIYPDFAELQRIGSTAGERVLRQNMGPFAGYEVRSPAISNQELSQRLQLAKTSYREVLRQTMAKRASGGNDHVVHVPLDEGELVLHTSVFRHLQSVREA